MDNLNFILAIFTAVVGSILYFYKSKTLIRTILASLFFLLFVGLVVFVFSKPEKPNPADTATEEKLTVAEARLKYYEARDLFDIPDYKSAIDILEPAVLSKPEIFLNSKTFSYAYLILGMSYWKIEKPLFDPSKAIDYLSKYLNQNSHMRYRGFARVNLSEIYKSIGQTEKAETILLEGVNDDPNYELFRKLGNLYYEKGKQEFDPRIGRENYRTAKIYFTKAIGLKLKDYWAHLGLSSALLALSECENAKKEMEEARNYYKSSESEDKEFQAKLNNNFEQLKWCR